MPRAVPSESAKDIIVARATAAGQAPVAIVRVSGPNLAEYYQLLFRPASGAGRAEAGKLTLGRLQSTEGEIDEALAVMWKAPRSFTGEDVIEFHLHGSTAIVHRTIEACVANGARVARPGEFTRRAYLNGRLDLAQAEAVCDLIRSQTDAAGRAALAQLSGGLSKELAAIREGLVPVVAELEAHIDFPEENLPSTTRERLGSAVDSCSRRIFGLIDSATRGTRLQEGARVVLAGPPNAGKSSLFNLLLKRERALVTPHAGTTRDTIEAEVDLGGVPVTLVDTAGLRDGAEEIETMGIGRTREELQGADLVLFLLAPSPPEAAAGEYLRLKDVPHLLVLTKSDLDLESNRSVEQLPGCQGLLSVSVLTRDGIGKLEEMMLKAIDAGESAEGALVTSRRHLQALNEAKTSLQRSAEGIASSLSPEFVVVDLTEAVAAIDRITGHAELDEDVLDAIFSTFCLGK